MLQLDEPRAAALRDLDAALAEVGHECVLIGGVAVSLVARARNTHDIDAMVVFDTARLTDLIAALGTHSFRPLFSGMEEAARDTRIAPVVHSPTGIKADLALGCMPFEEEVVARATLHRAGNLTVRLPTPEDLIILKAIANRPKDQEDIRTIAAVYPDVDRARIRYWVEQYAELLEEPELLREIEAILDSAVSS
ncbi:MAG: hypothetical protein FJX72_08945 [Armatimonadetes bacterium]|nr:hypothetical protein [Armatimonadota bacterium]